MKINGSNKLAEIFGERVQELFNDERFAAADVWYIDDVDTLNEFYAWFGVQDFKPSDFNNLVIVTTMEYLDFETQVRKGLGYVLKVNAGGQPDPISMQNLQSGWNAMYAPVLKEISNGSDNSKLLEMVITQTLFGILDLKIYLSLIPEVKESVLSFMASKKTELEQKVSDLDEAVNSGALALNENVSGLLAEKDEQLSQLTKQMEMYKQAAEGLMELKQDWETEKEEMEKKLQGSENSEELEQLRNEVAIKEQQLSEANEQVAAKDAEITRLQESMPEDNSGAVESLNEELTAKERELEEEKAKVAGIQDDMQALNSQIDSLKIELENAKNELVVKEQEMQDSNNSEQVAELEKVIQEKDNELAAKSSELESKTTELESKVSELESKTTELEAKSSELQEKEARIQELEKAEDNSGEISELQNRIAELEQTKASLEEQKTAWETEVDSLQKMLEQENSATTTLEQERDALEQEKANLEAKVKELESNGSNSVELAEEKSKLEQENSILQQKLDNALRDVSNKDELLSKVDGDRNTNELINKIEAQSKKLADCQAIISEMKDSESKRSNGLGLNIVSTVFGEKEDTESLRKEIQRLTSEIAAKDTQLKELTDGNDVSSTLRNENEDLRSKLAEANAKIEELTSKIGEVEI